MKMLRTLTATMAVLALTAAGAFAADLNQVVRTLEQGYASLSDLQAGFSQKSSIAALKREEKGGGELFIKKGSGSNAMFRFNYDKPKQQIVCNGKKVWYYLPENKQVMVMEASRLDNVALNYLTGMGHVSRDFSIVFGAEPKDRKGNYLLELTPKKKSAAMSRLQLTISGQAVERYLSQGHPGTPFPIVSSVVYDQMGNATRIDFSGVKTNRGMDSDRFTFKVPAGVEVVQR